MDEEEEERKRQNKTVLFELVDSSKQNEII